MSMNIAGSDPVAAYEKNLTIGIDIGGSTTKIIGIKKNKLITPMLVRATDPVASLFGAFGKFVNENNLSLDNIQKVMITGVGASYIERAIYGLPTGITEEFLSNGLGGLYLSELEKAIIVSMGTGTSLVKAERGEISYLGGTGIGGGTVVGLSSRMLNIRDIEILSKTAEDGDLHNVDLMVGDITKNVNFTLPPDTTASNFGRLNDVATQNDIALGIFNMVYQAIGTTANFAARATNISDIVLIGNLTLIPCCKPIFKGMADLFKVNFVLPKYSEYGTAVGAALSYVYDKAHIDI